MGVAHDPVSGERQALIERVDALKWFGVRINRANWIADAAVLLQDVRAHLAMLGDKKLARLDLRAQLAECQVDRDTLLDDLQATALALVGPEFDATDRYIP